ncbi:MULTISPECIES: UPF0280 family protein [Desulfococcus]|jgi:ApbE superfamily uncharacterized protein (UPF0280 family)|uniref:ApbE family lipoprotein n=1 Tax=Desulfococcus multivorans DSM 2059 TaxID=1121405 RepID=S7TBY3_DESML|nr:UPF0280 family protein [Desulfococcus multivorans]AOY58914.1 conserved uncharacterized protein, DUF375 [Desulfococcus multivorans]AQV02989.2 hypothetical protein B2D07_10690 [Desulfococcus multivorans]EPR34050.1 ApbE family lipoprotein [Desulfococcus multivorans DSM 2059]MDX9818434.1 UPF0280 family protein [Desulfococcus multivorans]SJZ53136.1 hypothetical protein SAMN02745446_00839 [Desulfococcus multivorans DSM 2059]
MIHEPRVYREFVDIGRRTYFKVRVKETDLFVHARKNLESLTRDLVLKHRSYIEGYIRDNPDFATSLAPLQSVGPAPAVIRDMITAGQSAGVGPMAAVAGALSEHVGRELLACSPEIIVENGGDVFIKADAPLTVALFAGRSPMSLRIGLRIDASREATAVCTSSGTIGHSLSLGSADAVCVVSSSCALADAVATAVGNRVRSVADIQQALAFGRRIKGVAGVVIVKGDKLGVWGNLELVPITLKRSASAPAVGIK